MFIANFNSRFSFDRQIFNKAIYRWIRFTCRWEIHFISLITDQHFTMDDLVEGPKFILLGQIIWFLKRSPDKQLSLLCIMSQNSQTHFKNLAVFAARFLKYAWLFWGNINERLSFEWEMKQYVLNKFYDVGLVVFIADLQYTENFTRVLLFVMVVRLPINDQRTSSYRNQSIICIANQLTGFYIMGNIGRWWVNSICQIFRLSMHELDTVCLLPFLSQDKSNKSIYPIKELANEFII